MQVRVDMPAGDFVVGRFVQGIPGARAQLTLTRTVARDGRFYLNWATEVTDVPTPLLDDLVAALRERYGEAAVTREHPSRFSLTTPEDAVPSKPLRALVRFFDAARAITGESAGPDAAMVFDYASEAVANDAAFRMRALLANIGGARVSLQKSMAVA